MKEIEQNVLAVLSTLTIDGNNIKITKQLDRKLYLAVNEVLNRIGGKWNRKAKAHMFDADPIDRLNNVIECGVLDPKVKTGYFPTPLEIVIRMLDLVDLDRKHLILEPSAGQGHIADEICKLLRLPPKQAPIIVCEILPENKHILAEKGYAVEECDFIEFVSECDKAGVVFDRIVMNPPFERQADITHVTAAFNLLAPGGILVTIMSAGVIFRMNKKTVEFREQIIEKHGTHLDKLPEGTFKESGTNVNTILLKLEK